MAQKREERLQTAIARYIKYSYPKVVFTSESSGIRVSMGVAVQMKKQRSNHKLPDMIILEPNKTYKGLMIELKKDHKEIYLKNGKLRNNEHIQEQSKTLELLKSKGYYACFSCGINETMDLIDNYMQNKL